MIGPLLSPQVVQAIEKKSQPSIFSQIFSAALANSVQKRLPSAPIVNANMAPAPAGSDAIMPMLLVGVIALGVVLMMMGGSRRG